MQELAALLDASRRSVESETVQVSLKSSRDVFGQHQDVLTFTKKALEPGQGDSAVPQLYMATASDEKASDTVKLTTPSTPNARLHYCPCTRNGS